MSNHRTYVVEVTEESRYKAVCSCGWSSELQNKQEDAENESTDHIVAVTNHES